MYYSRLIRLLFVALSFALVAKAIRPDVGRDAPNGAVEKRQLPVNPKRQLLDIGKDDDDDDDETSSDSKPKPTDDEDEETTTKDEPTTTNDDETSKPTPTTTETKTDDNTDKTDETTTTKDEKTETPTTSTSTKIVTTTDSNGKPTSFTTEDSVVKTPGLSDDGESGSSDGLSNQERNIVIGVVVGVGGAIVIGALAFVVLRIRNRKRAAEAPESYATMEPMDKPDSGHAPTGGITGPRNPFQSTLETYHAPTHVNASSNF